MIGRQVHNRRRFLAALATAIAMPAAPARAALPEDDVPLRVAVDPRVELLSIIFRLAGNPEYRRGMVPVYVLSVEERFGPFRDHPVVQLARRLRREHGISYDACMSMAVHIDDVETLGEAVPFDPRPPGLDGRWTIEDARLFLEKARDFCRESDFPAFLKRHERRFRTAVERMEKVAAKARLDWFEEFFGARPGARFTLILGMLNGPCSYGAAVRREEDRAFPRSRGSRATTSRAPRSRFPSSSSPSGATSSGSTARGSRASGVPMGSPSPP